MIKYNTGNEDYCIDYEQETDSFEIDTNEHELEENSNEEEK